MIALRFHDFIITFTFKETKLWVVPVVEVPVRRADVRIKALVVLVDVINSRYTTGWQT
jgi:hypothetical protein